MGISKDEFEKGIKPLDKGTLEYEILKYLRKAKKTDKPACTEEEILEAVNIIRKKDCKDISNYFNKVSKVQDALLNLERDGRIVPKAIKAESKPGYVSYYPAKG